MQDPRSRNETVQRRVSVRRKEKIRRLKDAASRLGRRQSCFPPAGSFCHFRLVSITSLVSSSVPWRLLVLCPPSRYIQVGHKTMHVNVASVRSTRYHVSREFETISKSRQSQLTGTFHLNANLPRALWAAVDRHVSVPPEA